MHVFTEKDTYIYIHLNFASRHPLQHKLNVVRALLDTCSKVVSEEQDRVTEEAHLQKDLSRCGYPEWTESQIGTGGQNIQEKATGNSRVYNRYGVSKAIRHHTTIRNLYHSKDKMNTEEMSTLEKQDGVLEFA